MIFKRYQMVFIMRTGVYLGLFMFTFSLACSQSWQLGIMGGPSFSRINSGSVQNETSREGYHIGMSVNTLLSEKLQLSGQLLYSAQGSTLMRSVATRNSTFDVTWENNLNYLNFPVTARYLPTKYILFEGGLYTGYLADASISREGDRFNTFTDLDRDHLQSFDWGMILGAGFCYRALTVGFRWQNGFSQIARSVEAERVFGDAANRVFQLYLLCFLPGKTSAARP